MVGDIGATNARFALVAPGSSDIENIQSLKCEDFDNIQSAISFYISSFLELDIVSACFATAGTVHLAVFKLANNHWTINKSDVAKTYFK